MGLEGSIEEFGLADILQLIYFQKKTGLLTVEGRLGRVRLSFLDGDIVDVETKGRLEDKRLGRVLIKKGLLEESRLKELLEKQKSSRERLGTYLVRNNFVSAEAVREVIINQLTETIIQLFNWKQGSYEFKPQKIAPDRELQIKVDTQHLLMEGLRMVDELSVIEGTISLDMVFRKTGRPGEELTEEENDLLGRIDGESDVSSLIEMSDGDDMSVSKLLISLLEKGAINQVEHKEFVVDKRKAGKERSLSQAVIALFIYLIIIASLVLSLRAVVPARLSVVDLQTERTIREIRIKLEQANFETGSYPDTLDTVAPGIRDAWGRQFTYVPDAAEHYYDLRSAGPDGIPGTIDDIY